jgi:hypothetical protein
MSLKITELPQVPSGTIDQHISIPVSKSETDPKTYRMSLAQTVAFLQSQGFGGGSTGSQGPQGGTGSSGPQGYSGPQGVPGSSGYSGVSGHSGYQGRAGSDNGIPGPGLVYTGYYRGLGYKYYETPIRRDVVSYSGVSGLVYYYTNSNTLSTDGTSSSGYSGWPTPGTTSDWANFGATFESVATNLLLAQDVSVTKGIVLGETGNLSAGFIRTANADWVGSTNSEGIWLGNDIDGHAKFFVGNYPSSYLIYDSSPGQRVVQLSGTIYATAGSIGGVGIANGYVYTGDINKAGTVNTPFFLNGDYNAVNYTNVSAPILYLGDSFKWYKKAGASTPTFNLLLGATGVRSDYTLSATGNYLWWDGTNLNINGTINVVGGNAATQSFATGTATTAAALASSTAYLNAKAVADSVAAGTYSGGSFISNTTVFAPIVAGAGGYFSETFKVGNNGITMDGIAKAIYIGGGHYSNTDTGFYVDSTGQFSLKDKLKWDGSNLTVIGTIKVSDGTEITSTTIGKANSSLQNNDTGKNLGLSGGTVGGVTISPNSLTLGTGTYGNSNTAFYVGNSGFSLGSNLTFDGSTLTVNGSVAIANNSGNAVKQGKTSYGSGTGFWLGDVSGTAKFDIGNSSSYMRWDGSNLDIHGIQTDDGIIVSSYVGLRYKNNSGVLTVTGGQDNGISNGAQIDFAGNSSAAPGVLSLNAGVGGGNGYIRFGTGPDLGSGANTARMTVGYDGLVNIQNNGNGSNAGNLTVAGTVTAGTYNTSSSRKWKTNISPITSAIETVTKLQGVTFDWNNKNITNDIGLIAEDVNEVLPTVVSKDVYTGEATGVDYGRLTALLIETVKELNVKIVKLENQLANR